MCVNLSVSYFEFSCVWTLTCLLACPCSLAHSSGVRPINGFHRFLKVRAFRHENKRWPSGEEWETKDYIIFPTGKFRLHGHGYPQLLIFLSQNKNCDCFFTQIKLEYHKPCKMLGSDFQPSWHYVSHLIEFSEGSTRGGMGEGPGPDNYGSAKDLNKVWSFFGDFCFS